MSETRLDDLIDFAAEPCEWEPGDCDRASAGLLCYPDGSLGVYCAEHLAAWKAELSRREERGRPKLPGLQDWYMAALKTAEVRDERG